MWMCPNEGSQKFLSPNGQISVGNPPHLLELPQFEGKSMAHGKPLAVTLFGTNPPFWRYIPWKHVRKPGVNSTFLLSQNLQNWDFVSFWGDVQSTRGMKKIAKSKLGMLCMYLWEFIFFHSQLFFFIANFKKRVNECFPKKCSKYIDDSQIYFWYVHVF